MSINDAKLNPSNPGLVKWHVLRFLSNIAEESSNLLTFDQIEKYVPDAMIKGNKQSDLYYGSIEKQLQDFVYPIFIRENVADFISYLEGYSNQNNKFYKTKACLRLGLIYFEGKIVKKDLDKSIEWFEKLDIVDDVEEAKRNGKKLTDPKVLYHSSMALYEKSIIIKDKELHNKFLNRCMLAAIISEQIIDAKKGRGDQLCPEAAKTMIDFLIAQAQMHKPNEHQKLARTYAEIAVKLNVPSAYRTYAAYVLQENPEKFYETLRQGAELGDDQSMIFLGQESFIVDGVTIPNSPEIIEKIVWNEIAISNVKSPEIKEQISQKNKKLYDEIENVDHEELCGKSRTKFFNDALKEIKSIKEDYIEKIRVNKNKLWLRNHLGFDIPHMDVFDQNYEW